MATADDGLLRRTLAVWDGQVESLPELEAELARPEPEDPREGLDRLTAAATRDLEDLRRAHLGPGGSSRAAAQRLARRLGWTVEIFRNWDPSGDQRGRRLDAALTAAAFWDMDGDLWVTLEPLLPERGVLCRCLGAIIRSRAVQAQVPADAPLWEREHLQALQRADRAADWARLAETARAFRTPAPDPVHRQAVRALWALDRGRLTALADRTETWMQASLLVAPLPLGDAFRLATGSTSGHIRFAAIERVINREKRPLSAGEQDALKNLFVVLAKDHASWSGWLAVWNRYPVRNPHLQGALGRALARGTTSAIRAYVDSIELSTPEAEGRACVAACLAEFRRRAAPSRRQALWSQAFGRWQAWNFAAVEGQELMTRGRSELDYAVVGWLLECADPTLVTAETEAFADQLRALEAEWHSSITSLISGFNRLLSRHQMFAFARSRTRDTSTWLCDQEIFTPEIAATAFVRSRYSLGET